MAKDEKSKHADTIIRNHSVWSLGAGAIPLALADLAAVSAVQVDMIRSLCEVYDVDFSATKGKALVSSLTSAALARVGAASVVKLIPVAGTLVGSVTGGVLAGASSYALGTAFKTHLSSGGTILDLDPDRLKKVYRDQFEKGKEKVMEWQAERGGDEMAEVVDEVSTKSRFRFDELIRRGKEFAGSAASADEEQAPLEKSKKASAKTTKKKAESKKTTTKNKKNTNDEDAVDEQASSSNSTISRKLEELNSLYERKLINKSDFDATKARLLEQL